MSNRKNTMNNDMDSDKRRPTVPSDQQAVPTPPAPPAVSAFPERSDYIGNAVNDVPTQVSETGSETEDVAVPRSRVVSRVLLAVITVIVLVALIVAVVLLPLPGWLVDSAKAGNATAAKQVNQTDLTYYCPSRMALSDNEKYGDSAFQASEGNMTSSARYSAFGSVYEATVGAVTNGSEADNKKLSGGDTVDSASVKTYSGSVDKGSQAFETRLLAAKSGTGAAASVASWATDGDLKGLSASTCVAPSLEQDFLLGPTTTGATQQLSVANFSAKATSLQVQVFSTKHGTPLQLSTGNIVNIGANGEATLELSAAAPNNEALFVKVKSKETPIAAVVRSVEMDGLNAKGSDYAVPLNAASKKAYLPGIAGDDDVTVFARSQLDTDLNLSWVDGNGATPAKTQHLEAGKVVPVDLGKAPEGVDGLEASAASPIDVTAKVTQNADSGTDFAYVSPTGTFDQTAVVVPDHTEGALTFLNTSDSETKASLRGYDASGKPAGSKEITIPAYAGMSIAAKDVDQNAVMFTLKNGKNVSMGMRLTQSDVTGDKLAAVAYLASSALEPRNMQVWVNDNAGIVR
ncbi:DUF5719 family protein [Bifidobacterium sp. ESL0732]|uniref:DUF5719 family protein n=1 Tax=Bifidobacterium sp. ESL0732 TaxID=2983222 RepID=UPI0023F734E2|nr:DUF5719 family protein [Bifidobacterium sp. ESL0732]WEV64656.1 DUF5719 family protein [Bifidobacterium sp. ESL0732]